MARLQNFKAQIAAGSLQHSSVPQAAPELDVTHNPIGVRSQHATLHLLHHPDRPLNIPITQEEGVFARKPTEELHAFTATKGPLYIISIFLDVGILLSVLLTL